MKKYLILLLFLTIYLPLFADNPNDPDVIHLRNNPNQLANIPIVFRVMQRYGVPDVNGDGVINCIDYSIRFRMLYGSDAKLMINNNRRNGMNHMFIRIWTRPGQFIDVEPQGTPTLYSMGLIWGTRYDLEYSRDVTNHWTHVVGGM
jgi:hypothetical protein